MMYTESGNSVLKVCEVAGVRGHTIFYTTSLSSDFIWVICYLSSLQTMSSQIVVFVS